MTEFTEEDQKICIRCQKCCKCVSFTIGINSHKEKMLYESFYKARGFKFKHFDSGFAVIIDSICPNLSQYGCKIYHSRPEACRMYDGRDDLALQDICMLPKYNSGDT